MYMVTKENSINIGDNVRINSRLGSNLVGLTNPTIFQYLKMVILKLKWMWTFICSYIVSSRYINWK